MRFLLIFLMIIVVIGCDNDQKRVVAKKGGIATKKGDFSGDGEVKTEKYDIDIDLTISPEMGGVGFEKIADSLGFSTNLVIIPTGDKEAVKGGKINLGLSSYPSTLRTYGKDANITTISNIASMVYEQLLYIDPNTLEYMPGLASHWKIDEDLQTFYFRIDPNAKWSDGNRVVANDVVKTFELLVDGDILAPYTNESYRKYEKPVAISKYIVKVKAKEKRWRKFFEFSATEILPAHYLKKINGKSYLQKYQYKMIPGSGPYILDENKTVKGTQIVLRRRSDYWGSDLVRNVGKNNFDEIKFTVIRDDVLEKEKFKKGDLDILIVGTAQWWVKEFEIKEEYDNLWRGLIQKRKVYNYKPKGISGLAYNMRKEPFDDIRVRKAFAMLWNRKQLIDKLFYNEYVELNSTYPGSVYENRDNDIYSYDPVKANKLLDEAGWSERDSEGYRVKGGKRFEIDLPIVQSREKIFTPLQADLKNAGIKLNVKISDMNSIFKMGDERRFTIISESWSQSVFPNPESAQHSKNADKDGTANTPGVKDEYIDKLCEEYNITFDQKRRVEILKSIDKRLNELVTWAYSWYSDHSLRVVYWNRFNMPKSSISKTGDWMDILRYWWYDSENDQKLLKARSDESIDFPRGDEIIDYWSYLKR